MITHPSRCEGCSGWHGFLELSPQSGEHRPPTFWGIGGALQHSIFVHFGAASGSQMDGIGEAKASLGGPKIFIAGSKNREKIIEKRLYYEFFLEIDFWRASGQFWASLGEGFGR